MGALVSLFRRRGRSLGRSRQYEGRQQTSISSVVRPCSTASPGVAHSEVAGTSSAGRRTELEEEKSAKGRSRQYESQHTSFSSNVRPRSPPSPGVAHSEVADTSSAGRCTELEEEKSAKDIDDRLLRRVSKQLGSEWERLATSLGFTATEISHFTINHPDQVESQIFSMLITWRQKQSSSVDQTVELTKALTEVDRVDLAEEMINVHSGQTTGPLRLEYCQQQVIQYYKDTTRTISAHPLNPTKVVGIDRFFALGLIKSLHERGLGHREMRASGIYTVLVDEPTESLKTWEDLFKSEVVGSVKVLLFGGAGAGKSTLLVKVANSCIVPDPESPLAKFKLVFLLRLRQMSISSCVIDAIFDQILPKNTKLTKQQVVKIISDNEEEIAFLLDGLDEIPSGVLESENGTYKVRDILRNRTLVKCCVLITTRPHMVDYVLKGYPNYARVETKGFTPQNRDRYIESYFRDNSSAGKLLISNIENRESLKTLALTPIITQMLCIVWKIRGSLRENVTDMYTEFAKVLVKRRCKEGQDASQLMESVLKRLGPIALDGMLGAQGERLIFAADEFEKDVLNKGCQIGFLQEESFTCGLTEEKSLVTFFHKSFQEFCAARHMSMLTDLNESKFHPQLEKISSTNVGEVENLLRFCCGTSVEAAGLILPHVNKMRGDEARLQRLARLLLFESGSGELVSKLDRPTKVKCRSHEDLMALHYYLQHVQQPLEETDINLHCYSIVDLRLLREILQCGNTHSVRSVWVYHFMSAQGKEELQLLEEILGSEGGSYRDRLMSVLVISPESWFDAEYVAGSLTRMSRHLHFLGLYLRQRLWRDVVAIAMLVTGLAYLGVSDIDLHGHVTRLAPAFSSLKSLELYDCGLVDNDVNDLIHIIPAGHGLIELGVSRNSFSLAALEALTRHLRGFPELDRLVLDNIGLDLNNVKEVVGKNLPHMEETESGWFDKYMNS